MVKSFKGEMEKVPKVDAAPKITVEDYMAKRLITFSPDQSIMDAISILLKNKISGGPVVNDQNELIGIISEGDCLKEIVKGKYDNIPTLTGTVSEHMAADVVSIAPETNVFEVAKMFLNKRLRRFPVVRNGKLVGQISQKDVMQAVTNLKSRTW
ncbi:MAG: CBS domain-containing protein [bacterium]|nr:CBS domain-containing protein [bacterium]